jgi:hypothetical protein
MTCMHQTIHYCASAQHLEQHLNNTSTESNQRVRDAAENVTILQMSASHSTQKITSSPTVVCDSDIFGLFRPTSVFTNALLRLILIV